MIADPSTADPNSSRGKSFRRRFRVPYLVFCWICAKCDEKNVFEIKRAASVEIPTTIKVLICLRILGRGDCCDSISELSFVSESHVNRIFMQFVCNFRKHFEKELIQIPQEEELKQIMDDYAKLGLPGSVGSVDVTHCYLDKCPSQYSNLCTGKEKKPTLAFEVVVTHRKKIISISKGEYGSYNDKTICRMDPFVRDVMNGTFFGDMESKIYDNDGSFTTVKGVHLICDNGYHKLPTMICPMLFRTDMHDVFWSEWIESVRKDVECTFGILKNRFRILKNPFQHHSLDLMEDVFVVCGMIHNVLLIVDNKWESRIVEECADVFDDIIDSDPTFENGEGDGPLLYDNENALVSTLDGNQNMIGLDAESSETSYQSWINFDEKVKSLVKHFCHCYNYGELRWMRTLPDGSKGFVRVGQRKIGYNGVLDRLLLMKLDEINNPGSVSYSPTLFIGKSKYRSLISTRSIGLGLFTRIDIPSGNEICRYIGERTSKEKYEEDARQGFSHYCIMISQSEYYNCYQQAKIGLCKASFANSPIQLEGAPKQNARREGMKLFAISAIPANEEVLCSYGLGYKFPRDTERTVLKFD